MTDELRELDHEAEVGRRLGRPSRDGGARRSGIEGGVALDSVAPGRVRLELRAGRLRPARMRPLRTPHMQSHDANLQTGRRPAKTVPQPAETDCGTVTI